MPINTTSSINKIPDEVLRHILELQAARPDMGDLGASADAIQELGFNTGAARLVCRRWSRVGKEILFRSISIRSTKDANHLASLLGPERPVEEGPVWTPAAYVKRVEIVFDKIFLGQLELIPNDILDILVNILLTCHNMDALAVRTSNISSDIDLNFVVSVLMSACPPLKRLELRINHWDNLDSHGLPPLSRHHHRSLETLWLSAQVLHQLFYCDVALPNVRNLIVERVKEDKARRYKLKSLRYLSLPALECTTIFSSPDVAPPDPEALITVASKELNLFGCHITDSITGPGLHTSSFDSLHSLGVTYRELGYFRMNKHIALGHVKSLTILMQEERGDWRVDRDQWQIGFLENAMYSLAHGALFPQLKEIRFWFPSQQDQNSVAWTPDEKIVWKDQLASLAVNRPEVGVYVGMSEEWWRAKEWEKVTANQAAALSLSSELLEIAFRRPRVLFTILFSAGVLA